MVKDKKQPSAVRNRVCTRGDPYPDIFEVAVFMFFSVLLFVVIVELAVGTGQG